MKAISKFNQRSYGSKNLRNGRRTVDFSKFEFHLLAPLFQQFSTPNQTSTSLPPSLGQISIILGVIRKEIVG